MKIWLVGSGYWGSKIASKLDKMQITYEIIDTRNGKSIDDINTLDPVMLATPLWEHFNDAKKLICAGHDLYIEKPAAEHKHQVQDLITATKKQVVMVGHIYMFNPILKHVKKIIDSGILGNINFIRSTRHNLGIYQTKTTPTLSLSPHDFTILDYLLDDIIVEDANAFFMNSVSQVPDQIQINGISKNIHWQIDVSWFSLDRKRQLIIMGDNAQLVWDDDAKTITIHYNRVENGKLQKNIIFPQTLHFNKSKDPLEYEIEHFVECVISRKKPISDLQQAYRIAKFIDNTHILLKNKYFHINL